jgi:CRP-like cAMP-binding protein
MGVYGRVAHVLMENSVPGLDNINIIRDKISRQDIAKMVGASREMVSRVMKDFEEQNFIETRKDGAILIKERRKVPR